MIHDLQQLIMMVGMLITMCTSNTHNMKACATDHHIWLWPEVIKGIELKTGITIPYQDEQDYLVDRR